MKWRGTNKDKFRNEVVFLPSLQAQKFRFSTPFKKSLVKAPVKSLKSSDFLLLLKTH